MALSPISLFQSNQTSLAQILQGGNQTVSGIMDRAIQIGRDISNKQMSQERDLVGIRQQETALQQRRGENLKQDWEDVYRFARGAFESNRNYGLQQQQLERQSARDLFSQEAETERIGIAREGLKMRREEMTAEQQAREAERARAKADRDEMSRLLGGGAEEPALPEFAAPIEPAAKGPSTTSPGAVASRLAKDPYSLFGAPPSAEPASPDGDVLPPRTTDAPAAPSSRETDLQRLGVLETLVKSKNLTEAQKAKANAEKTVLEDRLNPGGSTARAKTPEELEMIRLRLEKARREDKTDWLTETIGNNPKAFGDSAPGEATALRKFAAKKGIKPEDALWHEEFDAGMRDRLLAAQASDIARETAAVNASASEEDYVNKKTGIGEVEKSLRRETYRRIKGGGSAAPATGGSSPVRDLGI